MANARAQLKAAAYALVAEGGYAKAIEAVEEVLGELKSDQWDGK